MRAGLRGYAGYRYRLVLYCSYNTRYYCSLLSNAASGDYAACPAAASPLGLVASFFRSRRWC